MQVALVIDGSAEQWAGGRTPDELMLAAVRLVELFASTAAAEHAATVRLEPSAPPPLLWSAHVYATCARDEHGRPPSAPAGLRRLDATGMDELYAALHAAHAAAAERRPSCWRELCAACSTSLGFSQWEGVELCGDEGGSGVAGHVLVLAPALLDGGDDLAASTCALHALITHAQAKRVRVHWVDTAPATRADDACAEPAVERVRAARSAAQAVEGGTGGVLALDWLLHDGRSPLPLDLVLESVLRPRAHWAALVATRAYAPPPPLASAAVVLSLGEEALQLVDAVHVGTSAWRLGALSLVAYARADGVPAELMCAQSDGLILLRAPTRCLPPPAPRAAPPRRAPPSSRVQPAEGSGADEAPPPGYGALLWPVLLRALHTAGDCAVVTAARRPTPRPAAAASSAALTAAVAAGGGAARVAAEAEELLAPCRHYLLVPLTASAACLHRLRPSRIEGAAVGAAPLARDSALAEAAVEAAPSRSARALADGALSPAGAALPAERRADARGGGDRRGWARAELAGDGGAAAAQGADDADDDDALALESDWPAADDERVASALHVLGRAWAADIALLPARTAHGAVAAAAAAAAAVAAQFGVPVSASLVRALCEVGCAASTLDGAPAGQADVSDKFLAMEARAALRRARAAAAAAAAAPSERRLLAMRSGQAGAAQYLPAAVLSNLAQLGRAASLDAALAAFNGACEGLLNCETAFQLLGALCDEVLPAARRALGALPRDTVASEPGSAARAAPTPPLADAADAGADADVARRGGTTGDRISKVSPAQRRLAGALAEAAGMPDARAHSPAAPPSRSLRASPLRMPPPPTAPAAERAADADADLTAADAPDELGDEAALDALDANWRSSLLREPSELQREYTQTRAAQRAAQRAGGNGDRAAGERATDAAGERATDAAGEDLGARAREHREYEFQIAMRVAMAAALSARLPSAKRALGRKEKRAVVAMLGVLALAADDDDDAERNRATFVADVAGAPSEPFGAAQPGRVPSSALFARALLARFGRQLPQLVELMRDGFDIRDDAISAEQAAAAAAEAAAAEARGGADWAEADAAQPLVLGLRAHGAPGSPPPLAPSSSAAQDDDDAGASAFLALLPPWGARGAAPRPAGLPPFGDHLRAYPAKPEGALSRPTPSRNRVSLEQRQRPARLLTQKALVRQQQRDKKRAARNGGPRVRQLAQMRAQPARGALAAPAVAHNARKSAHPRPAESGSVVLHLSKRARQQLAAASPEAGGGGGPTVLVSQTPTGVAHTPSTGAGLGVHRARSLEFQPRRMAVAETPGLR